jgi:MtN3 and saliva related transmembrane protein
VTLPDLIGYMAATLTTISFVPQAWLTFRTRDVRGISLGMYSVFTVGIALWLAYGWLISAWPVVIANTITLALAASILAMKVLFRGMPPAADEDAAVAEAQAAEGALRS